MIITKKFGIILMIIGVAFQFLNILTYGYWGIDIDIIGALIFIIGLVILIVSIYLTKKKKKDKKKKKSR
jgi:LPXTG-motif cell wall-anchored protein